MGSTHAHHNHGVVLISAALQAHKLEALSFASTVIHCFAELTEMATSRREANMKP
jgi:hypothetical protein